VATVTSQQTPQSPKHYDQYRINQYERRPVDVKAQQPSCLFLREWTLKIAAVSP
jgi:hypothetical protein